MKQKLNLAKSLLDDYNDEGFDTIDLPAFEKRHCKTREARPLSTKHKTWSRYDKRNQASTDTED